MIEHIKPCHQIEVHAGVDLRQLFEGADARAKCALHVPTEATGIG